MSKVTSKTGTKKSAVKSKVAKASPEVPTEKKSKSTKKTANGEEVPKRSFKLVLDSIDPEVDVSQLPSNAGRYKGYTPMQAAKKAFSAITRKCGDKNKSCSYKYSIQEITEYSKKSTFTYIGYKKKLETPTMIKKQNKEYPVNFETTVKAYKPDLAALKATKVSKKSSKTAAPTKKSSKVSKKVTPPDNKEDEEEQVVEKEKLVTKKSTKVSKTELPVEEDDEEEDPLDELSEDDEEESDEE